MKYFQRQVQLWGEEIQESLASKRIVIVGCGGLGCSLGISLGSSGIGTIHLVDFDTVSLHNIHRQIAFTMEDVGKSKAEVLAELLRARYDGVEVVVHNDSFDTFTCKGVKVDLVLDATDNLPTRAAINAHAKSVNTPWIYASVEAFNGQVCFFEKSSFDAFKVLDKTPEGITAPIVMHIASLEANLALRYLAGLSVKKDWLYYLYFNDMGELMHQTFAMPVAAEA
jgi:molybdopterin/thiamine biosynthesis adenylyltransferase